MDVWIYVYFLVLCVQKHIFKILFFKLVSPCGPVFRISPFSVVHANLSHSRTFEWYSEWKTMKMYQNTLFFLLVAVTSSVHWLLLNDNLYIDLYHICFLFVLVNAADLTKKDEETPLNPSIPDFKPGHSSYAGIYF